MAAAESPTYPREKVNVAVYRIEVWRAIIDYLEQRKPPMVVRRNAACSGQGVDVFFPATGVSTRAAKAVCDACPVIEPCRGWAIKQPG